MSLKGPDNKEDPNDLLDNEANRTIMALQMTLKLMPKTKRICQWENKHDGPQLLSAPWEAESTCKQDTIHIDHIEWCHTKCKERTHPQNFGQPLLQYPIKKSTVETYSQYESHHSTVQKQTNGPRTSVWTKPCCNTCLPKYG